MYTYMGVHSVELTYSGLVISYGDSGLDQHRSRCLLSMVTSSKGDIFRVTCHSNSNSKEVYYQEMYTYIDITHNSQIKSIS